MHFMCTKKRKKAKNNNKKPNEYTLNTLMLINKHMSNDCSSSNEIYEIRLMIRIDDWNCHALNKCRNCLLNIWFWNYHCASVWVCFVSDVQIRCHNFSPPISFSLQSHRRRTYTMRSFARIRSFMALLLTMIDCISVLSAHNFLQFEWFIGNIIVAISIRDVQTQFWTFSFLVCSSYSRSLVSSYLFALICAMYRSPVSENLSFRLSITHLRSKQRKRWVFTLKIECVYVRSALMLLGFIAI